MFEDLIKELNVTGHLTQDLLILGSILTIIIIIYFMFNFFINVIHNKLKRHDKVKHILKTVTHLSKTISTILFIVIFFFILSYGLYKIYLGVDLLKFGTDYINNLPKGFWLTGLINISKVAFLIIVAKYANSIITKWLDIIKIKALEYKNIKTNEKSIKSFFIKINRVVYFSIIFIVSIFAIKLFGLPHIIAEYLTIAFKIFIYMSLGLIFITIISVIVQSLDALSKRYAETKGWVSYYLGLQHLVGVFNKTLEYITYTVTATLVVKELSFVSWLADFGEGTVKAIGYIFIARVAIEVTKLVINKLYLNDQLETEKLQQNKTIFPILISSISIIVYFIIGILIIKGFGFDPLPLLTGAGILGMVIGMGAKDLIADALAGFFIIFDGTFKVGDRIGCNDVVGVIEHMSLRVTRFRAANGALVTIRNGELKNIINYSHNYINAVVSIGIAPDSDINKAYKILDEVGADIKKSNSCVLEDIDITGVKELNGTQIVIRTSMKVKVGTNFVIESELRKKIVKSFKEAEIELAPLVYEKLK